MAVKYVNTETINTPVSTVMEIIFVNTNDCVINALIVKGLVFVSTIYENHFASSVMEVISVLIKNNGMFVSNVLPLPHANTVNSSTSAIPVTNPTASLATVFSIQTRRFRDAIASKSTMSPTRFRPSLVRILQSLSTKPWKEVVPSADQISAWILERIVS